MSLTGKIGQLPFCAPHPTTIRKFRRCVYLQCTASDLFYWGKYLERRACKLVQTEQYVGDFSLTNMALRMPATVSQPQQGWWKGTRAPPVNEYVDDHPTFFGYPVPDTLDTYLARFWMTTVVEMRWLRSDSVRRDQKKESFNKSIIFYYHSPDSLIKEILVFERQWRHWREGNCWDCNLLDNRCVAASSYNANGLLTLMTPVVDEATVNSIWSKQRLFLIVGAWLPWY